MEKGKSCSKQTISTVEGGFKIRVCDDKDSAKQESKKENGNMTWEDTSR